MRGRLRLPEVLSLLWLGTLLLTGTGCSSESASDRDEWTAGTPVKTWVSPKDGAVMVYVPAGWFLMGTSDEDIEAYKKLFPYRSLHYFENERPQRRVYLDAFYIDQTEVTNRQYQRFLAETGYQPKGYLNRPPWNEPDYPAIVMVWEDAEAYARWAGKRLPTEAEWEKAARGTDGRFWPWGNEWDPTRLSGNDGTGLVDGYQEMAPVGQFPQGASPYGALDMAGNAWEWVADWYDPFYYRYAPNRNPPGPPTGDGHVLRGGGWAENHAFTRCASRVGGNPGSLLVGFRTAIDAP
ncbi:MAG: sulfatase modifying factor 2 [Candidatus Poribacteria bacterium]|nr:MAG: sulfatase modifying factor 2 [Candidatus Poribacteria bacterium]